MVLTQRTTSELAEMPAGPLAVHDAVESQALAAIDRIEQAIAQAETPLAALDARDAARNASIYARMVGLQEEGVRLQNLVMDAERKIVEIVPRRQGSDNLSPWGDKLSLSPQKLHTLRKTYELLDDETFEDLKSAALVQGEPLTRAAVGRATSAIRKARAKREAEEKAREEAERKAEEARAAEEEARVAEEEARRKAEEAQAAEEEAARAEEEAKVAAEEEARRKAEEAQAAKEEARRKAEEARVAAEEEARRKAEEEARRSLEVPVGTRSKVVLVDNMDQARGLVSLEDESVALTFTSPPYWTFAEYGGEGVSYESSYPSYIKALQQVFSVVWDKTLPGGRTVVNISNMKSRQSVEGAVFVYPIVADVIRVMDRIGFTFYDELIWHKRRTTTKPMNGSPLWGSYPYPPTPKILDSTFENILVFSKPGQRAVDLGVKERSRLSMEDWQEYTKGVWGIESDSDPNHPATFPVEIADRVIRMYSFVGDVVLDPFAGTGTTILSAERNERAGVGYEISPMYKEAIHEKAGRLGSCRRDA